MNLSTNFFSVFPHFLTNNSIAVILSFMVVQHLPAYALGAITMEVIAIMIMMIIIMIIVISGERSSSSRGGTTA
jgi:hypothetical protein